VKREGYPNPERVECYFKQVLGMTHKIFDQDFDYPCRFEKILPKFLHEVKCGIFALWAV
jgi:hypothetical protein